MADAKKEPIRTLFWVELVCAECSTTTEGTWTAGKVDVRTMKKGATQSGWSFEGIQSFCSSRCRQTFEAR